MNFTLILLVIFNYSAETTSKNCHQLSDLFFICLILIGYLRENVVKRVEFLENKTCSLWRAEMKNVINFRYSDTREVFFKRLKRKYS